MTRELPKSMNCVPAGTSLRIAVVYSRVPFPMMRGDQLTVAHLISFLAARGHAVDLHYLDVDGSMTPAQAAWLERSCRTVHRYAQPRRARLLGLLLGLARLLPLQVAMFRNRELTVRLRRLCDAGEYDVVYCYYPRTAEAIPLRGRATGPATFLALQLSQTLNTRRMAEHDARWFKRALYRLEARLMGRYESRVWQDFERVMLIGPADVEAVKAECRRRGRPEIDNWAYGAHGTDTERYQPAAADEIVPGRIVFSGSMLYPPNIQAATWFADRVFPLVKARVPAAEFFVQGRDPVPEVVALAERDGIVVTGTVPDVGEIIRSASVCVNPMLAAGGMQNKLIEYMACGKAVVASAVANEGIGAPRTAIVVENDAAAFADAVVQLLEDPVRAWALGRAAREYVVAGWTWESHFLLLESEFLVARADAGLVAS